MAEESTGPYGTESSKSSKPRINVDEAARALGVTVDAIRKRVQRGTLPYERDESGRVWVLLEAARAMQERSSTVRDTSGIVRNNDQEVTGLLQRELLEAKEETIIELRERVASLERQMEAERESRRRADTIIARLTEANAALAERPRELEAPEEALDASEEKWEASKEEEPQLDAIEPQEVTQTPEETDERAEQGSRRPWWLRWLGE